VRRDSTAARELARYHGIVDLVALSAPLRRADPRCEARILGAARADGGEDAALDAGRSPRRLPRSGVRCRLRLGRERAAGLTVQARHNAALAAIVEGECEAMSRSPERRDAVARRDLQTQPDGARRPGARHRVSADRNAKMSVLEATSAGHGAIARYLWSGEAAAGVLLARGLPDLPLDSVYQVWFDDGRRTFSVGTFTPDERSAVQKVVRLPAGAGAPQRVSVSVAPAGGASSVGRIVVLSGAIEANPRSSTDRSRRRERGGLNPSPHGVARREHRRGLVVVSVACSAGTPRTLRRPKRRAGGSRRTRTTHAGSRPRAATTEPTKPNAAPHDQQQNDQAGRNVGRLTLQARDEQLVLKLLHEEVDELRPGQQARLGRGDDEQARHGTDPRTDDRDEAPVMPAQTPGLLPAPHRASTG
jgi:hypothetical protein